MSITRNTKVGTRISGIIAILLLFIALVAMVAMVKMNRIGKELDGIAKEDIPLTEVLSSIAQHRLATMVEVERGLTRGLVKDEGGIQQALATVQSIGNNVKEELQKAQSLIADAMRAVASSVVSTSDNPTPFDVAVIPAGVVRDPIYKGKTGVISFADAYNAVPLGISPDQTPGYPLISMYVTGEELKSVAEVAVSVAPMLGNGEAYLFFAGMRFTYNPNGIPLARVERVFLCNEDDFYSIDCVTPLVSDQAYRLVVDLYTGLMMSVVSEAGLTIVPRDAFGNPITLTPAGMLEHAIDADPITTDTMEYLKEWACLVGFLTNYLSDTESGSALPDVPAGIYGPGGLGLGRAAAE